jgi:hypothetical protein
MDLSTASVAFKKFLQKSARRQKSQTEPCGYSLKASHDGITQAGKRGATKTLLRRNGKGLYGRMVKYTSNGSLLYVRKRRSEIQDFLTKSL